MRGIMTFDGDAHAVGVRYRRRILRHSQPRPALHAAGAFFVMEIVDTIYHGLSARQVVTRRDCRHVLMSKGLRLHGQYVISRIARNHDRT